MFSDKDNTSLLPKSVKFGFKNVEIKGNTMRGECKFCKSTNKCFISDKVGVTSNFLKHLHQLKLI